MTSSCCPFWGSDSCASGQTLGSRRLDCKARTDMLHRLMFLEAEGFGVSFFETLVFLTWGFSKATWGDACLDHPGETEMLRFCACGFPSSPFLSPRLQTLDVFPKRRPWRCRMSCATCWTRWGNAPAFYLKTPDDRQCPLNVIRAGPIVHTKRLWRSAGSQPSRADQESLLRV